MIINYIKLCGNHVISLFLEQNFKTAKTFYTGLKDRIAFSILQLTPWSYSLSSSNSQRVIPLVDLVWPVILQYLQNLSSLLPCLETEMAVHLPDYSSTGY